MSKCQALTFASLFLCSFVVLATDASHHHEVGEYLKVNNTDYSISQSEAHQIITDANWKQAIKVDIVFDDDYYEPDELVLKQGQPYVLQISNIGERLHDVSGEEFFSNVVVKDIVSDAIEISAYHLESLHVRPGKKVQVRLVVKESGQFPFICTLPGHMHDGMAGTLTVQPE